jgi:hypothetical protein
MNTVHNMFSNASAVQGLRDGGYGAADFDIEVAPLTYEARTDECYEITERMCSSKSVIYRTDSGAELGVHGRGYKPIAPKKIVDTTRTVMERSELNLVGLTEQIRTSHDGARCFVQYNLPAHTYETGDGDTASLSLLATSSFDGTWPFMISVAAVQSACTNLQVFVSGEIAVYKAKHTQSLDIEHGANIIVKSLDVFNNERELWKAWQGTQVRDMEAFYFFADALDVKLDSKSFSHSYSPADLLHKLPRRNENLNYIWRVYDAVYRNRLGANWWAVYNAMTDWSTHFGAVRQSSERNIASIQNERQQVIRKAIKSEPALRLAA